MTSLQASNKTMIHLRQYPNEIYEVDGLFGRAWSAAFLPFVRQRAFVMSLVTPQQQKRFSNPIPITRTGIRGNAAGKLLRIYFRLYLIIIFKCAKQIRCFQTIN